MRKLLPLTSMLLLALAGCGGGGGGTSPTPTTVSNATFQIAWPARSRDSLDHGLNSAQSALVTLVQADPSGADVQVRVNRDGSKVGAYTGVYTVSQAINKSVNALTATFYAQASESGDVVGSASAAVTVSGSTLSLASISVIGKIQNVSVLDSGDLTIGSGTTQLLASATDEHGVSVAVTPGSFLWRIASGASSLALTNDGVATPLAAGSPSVVATVDGKSSSPKTLTVKASAITGASFKITWPARTRSSLTHPLTSALSAEVTFVHGSSTGSDITLTVNRDTTNLLTHTETYQVGQPLSPSVGVLSAKFYAGADKSGELVGAATATVQPNGTDLSFASIVVDGKVKTVNVLDPGLLIVGSSAIQLQAIALDSASNPIAITPGSLKWSVPGGGSRLTVSSDGVASAVSPGTATVRAVVDGVASPNMAVTIQDNNIHGASFQITWPERTRALDHSLSSALSAEVTLVDGNPNGQDIKVVVNRDQTITAVHTETYPVGVSVVPNVSSLTANFYAGADKTGALVGTASGVITPSGTDLQIAHVVVKGTIKTLSVTLPGAIFVGNPIQLQVTAKDSNEEILAISAGSITWSQVSGADCLAVTPDGIATAKKTGNASIKATVDGVTAAKLTLTTAEHTQVKMLTASTSVVQATYDKVSGKIWATTSIGAEPQLGQSLVSIDPLTGAIIDHLDFGLDTPGYVSVTDDGRYAFVTFDESEEVKKIDLKTLKIAAAYPVHLGGYAEIRALPGTSHSFAIVADGNPATNLSVWDDGVVRPGRGKALYRFLFSGPTLAYSDGVGVFYATSLDPDRVRTVQELPRDIRGFDFSGGYIYTGSGRVVNPTTNQLISTFLQRDFFENGVAAINEDENRAYFLTWDNTVDRRVLVFDKNTGVDLPTVYTGVSALRVSDTLLSCGSHAVFFTVNRDGAIAQTLYIVRNLP